MLRQTLRSALSPIPRAVRTLGASPSPAVLFAASEQGAWYDPADFSTLYQDSAGTTPVTAVGQPVGMMLDKRLGAVRGAEAMQSGAAASLGAPGTPSSYNTATGAAFLTRTDASNQGYVWFNIPANSWAELTLSVPGGGNGVQVRHTNAASTVAATISPGATQRVIVPTSATAGIYLTANTASGTATCTVTSIRELPGNHATQATAAARPVLSARVNLLNSTNTYAGAAWSKRGAVTVGAAAPDGTGELLSNVGLAGTNDIWQSGTGAGTVGTPNTPRVEIWPVSTTGTLTIANPSTGADGRWFVNFALLTPGRWNVITASHPAVTVSAAFVASASNTCGHHYSGDVPLNFYARYPDVRTTADAALAIPAYQRVNTATDYDTAGFPCYLSFDGVDDSLATGSIDFSATDKMTVFAGVHQIGTGIVAELSAIADSSAGAFHLYSSSSATRWQAALTGSAGMNTYNTAIGTPPMSKVVALAMDLGAAAKADELIPRVNGVVDQTTSGGVLAGTGNYGNYPLYIGRRGGTTLPFNGRLYSLIVRGATTDATTLARTERFVGSRMGIAL